MPLSVALERSKTRNVVNVEILCPEKVEIVMAILLHGRRNSSKIPINFGMYQLLRRNTMLLLTSLALLFLCVVIPNSLHAGSAVALVFCFAIAATKMKFEVQLKPYFFYFFLSIVVTAFYMLIGIINGAPLVAVQQVVVVYVLSPLMWSVIFIALIQKIGKEALVRIFVGLTILCILTVAMYFYLYNSFGPAAVSFFREDANVNVNDEGYAAATMHVYGSLIFISGAFFAAPETIKNRLYRYVILAALLICAITSGRSALILAIPVGFIVGFFLGGGVKKNRQKKIGFIAAIVIISILAAIALNYLYGISTDLILQQFYEELSSGGGSARSEQIAKLMESVYQHYGLGMGHGIGVDYIRSYEFPWRYEAVWAATLHRVGYIGALIYTMPFFAYSARIFAKSRRRELSTSDRFMYGGFLCAFLASNTNPYIEAFSFQWMYIVPVVCVFAEAFSPMSSKFGAPRETGIAATL
jgi:hypothetical protein